MIQQHTKRTPSIKRVPGPLCKHPEHCAHLKAIGDCNGSFNMRNHCKFSIEDELVKVLTEASNKEN